MRLYHALSPRLLPSLGIAVLFFACSKHQPGNSANLTATPAMDTVGGVITLSGGAFDTDPGNDIVQFNDSTEASIVSVTKTQISVRVPYGTAHDKITVKTKTAVYQTTKEFVVVPNFYPRAESPGYPITVIAGGSTNPSDYVVSFNARQGKITGMVDHLMTVIVPDGATSGPISVTYNGKASLSINSFTVAPTGTVSTFATGLSGPVRIAIDPMGNLFVVDHQGGMINKVTPDGAVSVYAGDGSFNSIDGPRLSAAFHEATGLAFSPNGDLYVAERAENKIRKISADIVTTFMQGGGPAASYVAMPTDLCIDGAGNFYVGDDLHLQIKKISPAGQVSVIAGLDGYQASVNGPALNAGFVSPEGVLLDPSGALFVADWHRIREISNGTVSTFAGSTGDFRDGTGTDASFNLPGSIVRDGAGNLYVTDPGNNLIRMITPAGVVTTLAGSPKVKGYADGVGAAALFNRANGIAIDKNGVLYVSDFGNNCIRRITVK